MNSRPWGLTWRREPSPSASWNHITPPTQSKANIQADCDFRQQKVRTPTDRSIVIHSHSRYREVTVVAWACLGFGTRSLSISETSVLSSEAHGPSGGLSRTALGTRSRCPLSASVSLHPTKRLWTVLLGKTKQKDSPVWQLCLWRGWPSYKPSSTGKPAAL